MSKKLSYWLDNNDIIRQVDESWDSHMDSECWTDRACSSGIIGKPLFDFICDDVTRMYVATMVASVRVIPRTIVRPYRCDLPDCKRYWNMVISPEQNGWVCVSHELVREELLSKSVIFETQSKPKKTADNKNIPHQASYVVRCSICNRLKDQKKGRWLDIDQLADTDFLPTAVKKVIYNVCPDCLNELYSSLQL